MKIILDKDGVKSDIAHGLGRGKCVTFASIPEVIEKGVQIDYQPNWKNRGYDTYIFAAPVQVGKETAYVAVVVKKGRDNNYYLHEAVDSNGNFLKIEEETTAFKTGDTTQGGLSRAVASSIDNIPQNEDIVNSQYMQEGEDYSQEVSGDMLSLSEQGTKLFNSLSVSEQRNFVKKVQDLVKKLKNWATDLLKQYESGSYEAKQMRKYQDELNALSKKWDQMIKQAVVANQALQQQGITGEALRNQVEGKNETSNMQFSYKGLNADGIEVYVTSKNVLKLPWKERKKRYLNLMKNTYSGRTAKFKRNGHYYYAEFDLDNLKKIIYGEKRSDNAGRDAIINAGADGDVFNIVENSEYTRSGKDKKNHKMADYFDYFVKTVQIDNKVFDILADVQKKYGTDGGYVYTIKLTENKKIKASPIQEIQTSPLKNSGNALIDIIISQPTKNVNAKKQFSDKDTEYLQAVDQGDMVKAQKMVDEFGKVERLKGEVRLTKRLNSAWKVSSEKYANLTNKNKDISTVHQRMGNPPALYDQSQDIFNNNIPQNEDIVYSVFV